MKLHLGCGQRYLPGYINIDYPSSSHTVQTNDIADYHADILSLCYPTGSIEEVRLHHVFEHFSRPIACALLTTWHTWLQPEGRLHIEVPDFKQTSKVVLNPFSSIRQKSVAVRHLYGSHEAEWAVHCEGYTSKSLKTLLSHLGFRTVSISKNHWKGTYNFEIVAKKQQELSIQQLCNACKEYLSNFLVGDSEEDMLRVWLELYQKQVNLGLENNG